MILKASVHKTGRLGFSSDAAEYLGLKEGYSASILMNDDDSNDKNLYVQIHHNQEDSDNFKIGKAGEYFYIGMKWFYHYHNEDYLSQDISYDITKTEIDGEPFFVFKRKLTKGSNGEAEEDE